MTKKHEEAQREHVSSILLKKMEIEETRGMKKHVPTCFFDCLSFQVFRRRNMKHEIAPYRGEEATCFFPHWA